MCAGMHDDLFQTYQRLDWTYSEAWAAQLLASASDVQLKCQHYIYGAFPCDRHAANIKVECVLC